MWRLKESIVGTAVYGGKKLTFANVRANVKQLHVRGEDVQFGIVTSQTKTVYRSETAKVMIFVQMSREMWDFDEDGQLYFEKAVQGFLPELFDRWAALGATHVVSIVLFSRFFYNQPPTTDEQRGSRPPNRDTRSACVDVFVCVSFIVLSNSRLFFFFCFLSPELTTTAGVASSRTTTRLSSTGRRGTSGAPFCCS